MDITKIDKNFCTQTADENGFIFIHINDKPIVKSGVTGDCAWTLVGTELTVSGKGWMENYRNEDAPWGKQITSVVINNGVTSIGDRAFFGCKGLTDATIPDIRWLIGNQ